MSRGESIPHDGRYALQGHPGAVEEALKATDLPQRLDKASPGCQGSGEDGAEGLAGIAVLRVKRKGPLWITWCRGRLSARAAEAHR